jgi:hypothetical protein
MNKIVELKIEETKAVVGGNKAGSIPVVVGANPPPVIGRTGAFPSPSVPASFV